MRRKPKVEKVRISLSVPKELLEEAEFYIDNFSAYFSACLRNKVDYMKRVAENNETRCENIIQTKRNTRFITQENHYSTPQDDYVDEVEYNRKLELYLAKRKTYADD